MSEFNNADWDHEKEANVLIGESEGYVKQIDELYTESEATSDHSINKPFDTEADGYGAVMAVVDQEGYQAAKESFESASEMVQNVIAEMKESIDSPAPTPKEEGGFSTEDDAKEYTMQTPKTETTMLTELKDGFVDSDTETKSLPSIEKEMGDSKNVITPSLGEDGGFDSGKDQL